MPPRTPKRPKPPSKLSIMLAEAVRRATYFVTPEGLSSATLPTGQSVPLWSEDFYRWFSATLNEQGVAYPTPQQYAAALRALDQTARTNLDFRPVHLRSAEIRPNHYRVDLQSATGHSILINGKDWTYDDAQDAAFRRPSNNLALPFARKTSIRLEVYLENVLKITPAQAHQLRNWLIRAMLPGSAPVPFLILKGKARDKAVGILRNLIDPAIHPIHAMPHTAQGISKLAQHNRVLAFSIFGQISQGKVATLKALRAGTLIPIWERNKRGGKIAAKLQRPIIIATDEDLKFESNMFTLEVNETVDTRPDEFYGAMLTAVVEAIRQFTKSNRPQVAEQASMTIPEPPRQALQAPAPYS